MGADAKVDIEMCLSAGYVYRSLVRAVTTDVACCGTSAPEVIDEVRRAAESTVLAMTPLARPGSQVRCAFTLTGRQICIRVRALTDQIPRRSLPTTADALMGSAVAAVNATTAPAGDGGTLITYATAVHVTGHETDAVTRA